MLLLLYYIYSVFFFGFSAPNGSQYKRVDSDTYVQNLNKFQECLTSFTFNTMVIKVKKKRCSSTCSLLPKQASMHGQGYCRDKAETDSNLLPSLIPLQWASNPLSTRRATDSAAPRGHPPPNPP